MKEHFSVNVSTATSEKFRKMPSESRLLYFHLLSCADSDGTVRNLKAAMRGARIKEGSELVLINNGYLKDNSNGTYTVMDEVEE